MHAFSLTIGSMLGHSFAKELVTEAQKVVTFFRASTRALAVLTAEARHLNISKVKPVTSNTTRFTSVHNCLASLVTLQQALKNVLVKSPEVIKHEVGITFTSVIAVETAATSSKWGCRMESIAM